MRNRFINDSSHNDPENFLLQKKPLVIKESRVSAKEIINLLQEMYVPVRSLWTIQNIFLIIGTVRVSLTRSINTALTFTN